MLEIDGDAIADHRLHLPDAPVGPAWVADAHAWFDDRAQGPVGNIMEASQRIPSAPMTQGMPRPMPPSPPFQGPDLAKLLGLRLCHDLGGLAGTVGNALDMLDSIGPEASALASDAATGLRRRLLLWRAMLGGQEGATLGTLLDLLEGQLAGGRATADATAADPAMPVAPGIVPVLLSAMMVAGEALPRGGVVRLAADGRQGFAILPEGPRIAWSPTLVRIIGGGALLGEPTAREVLPLWLGAMAAAERVQLGMALAPGGGTGPLMLTLPA